MAAIRPNPALSADLIDEILVRLPVKSIVRCQLVSKTWLSQIRNPAFIRYQLLRAITIQTDQTLIIRRWASSLTKLEGQISLVHVDSRRIVADLVAEFKSGSASQLIGSANGIVCAIVWVGFGYATRPHIYLWNPAIREARVITQSRVIIKSKGKLDLGFGYDPIDDDFKLVCVFGRLPAAETKVLSAEVYSANRNVWHKVPDPIDAPLDGNFHVCVNGFLCGIGEYGMFAFDLNKEVMNCGIKLPFISVDVDDVDEAQTRIIEFNKSIVVIILWANALIDGSDRTDRRLHKKINMWMLDDDACLRGGGVEASWTLKFSIDLGMPAHLINGYFSNGDLLLLISLISNEDPMLILCNAKKLEVKILPLIIEMAGPHYITEAYKYTESLVSLDGFEQVNLNAGEDDN